MLAPEFNPSQILAIPARSCVTVFFFFPLSVPRAGEGDGEQTNSTTASGLEPATCRPDSPRQGAVSWNLRRPGEDTRSSHHPESHFQAETPVYKAKWQILLCNMVAFPEEMGRWREGWPKWNRASVGRKG